MKAIIVGGGIGGLSAAIALRRVGVEATVFERTGKLGEIGAGISLWANAMKALRKLGLYDAVQAVGRPLRPSGELRSWRGEAFYEVSAAAMEERFGDVNVTLHRADLQKTLLAALDEDTVRLDAEFAGFEQDQGGVLARFANGREERSDLLVGADGLHSVVRRQLLGDGLPRYAGYTAWRGVVELEEDPVPGGGGFESWGRGGRFGLAKLGRGRTYWYATKNAPEGEEDAPVGRKGELLARFGRWHKPIPTVIRATEESRILRNDVYDREPIKRWGEGRVTLLGDAAHPMTPDLGQGACQAIEDAVVLAGCLKEEGETEAALRFYEALRVDRTAYIARQSRRLARIGQLENPLVCWLRGAVLKALPQHMLRSRQLEGLEPVVGFEAWRTLRLHGS